MGLVSRFLASKLRKKICALGEFPVDGTMPRDQMIDLEIFLSLWGDNISLKNVSFASEVLNNLLRMGIRWSEGCMLPDIVEFWCNQMLLIGLARDEDHVQALLLEDVQTIALSYPARYGKWDMHNCDCGWCGLTPYLCSEEFAGTLRRVHRIGVSYLSDAILTGKKAASYDREPSIDCGLCKMHGIDRFDSKEFGILVLFLNYCLRHLSGATVHFGGMRSELVVHSCNTVCTR